MCCHQGFSHQSVIIGISLMFDELANNWHYGNQPHLQLQDTHPHKKSIILFSATWSHVFLEYNRIHGPVNAQPGYRQLCATNRNIKSDSFMEDPIQIISLIVRTCGIIKSSIAWCISNTLHVAYPNPEGEDRIQSLLLNCPFQYTVIFAWYHSAKKWASSTPKTRGYLRRLLCRHNEACSWWRREVFTMEARLSIKNRAPRSCRDSFAVPRQSMLCCYIENVQNPD